MRIYFKKFKIYFVLFLLLDLNLLDAKTSENTNYLDIQTLSFASIAKDDF